jgi:hypothetical protein
VKTLLLARRISLGVVCVGGAVRATPAQGTPESVRPAWRAEYPPALGELMTAAERAAAMATLAEIERILWRVPELARPRGFEVLKQEFGGSTPLGERGVLEYGYYLWFFVPSKAIAGDGPKCITVTVNHPGPAHLVDESGRGLIIEKEIGVPKPGATIAHEGLRWDTPTADRQPGYNTFTPRGVSPWLPVTREQYLRALILTEEGKNGEREAATRKSLEKTTYERWMDEAAERKKTRDDAIASMARNQGRAAGDELRKQLEQTERAITEQYKAMEAEERKQNAGALTNRFGDQLRAQLAALTPAQRAGPATADLGAPDVPPDDPSRRLRVLTPDPAFWRVRRTRAEVHSITVAFFPGHACGSPAVRAALEKAWDSLDWMAFKRIVDRPS